MESLLTNWHFSLSNLSGLSFLLDINSLLSSEELDVGLTRKIGTDSTVGSVCSSSSFCSSINLDVINCEVFKVFGVGIWLEVINKSQNDFDWFLGPSSESFSELSGLSGSSDSSVVFSIGDTSSVSEDVLEILFGFGDGETFDGFGSLIGVFIMNSEISGWRFSDYVRWVLPLEVAGFLEYVVFPITFINYYFNINITN